MVLSSDWTNTDDQTGRMSFTLNWSTLRDPRLTSRYLLKQLIASLEM